MYVFECQRKPENMGEKTCTAMHKGQANTPERRFQIKQLFAVG